MKKMTYALVLAALLSAAACKNDKTACDTNKEMMLQQKETALNEKEQLLIQRETAVAQKEAQMVMQGSTSTAATTNTAAVAAAPVATAANGKATGQYKVRKFSGNIPDSKGKKPMLNVTHGQYPEGTDRLLQEKDVQYLTQWGAKVMLSEIYARHGMRFKDAALKAHYNKEGWYHGSRGSVNKMLTATEKQNIAFIREHRKEQVW